VEASRAITNVRVEKVVLIELLTTLVCQFVAGKIAIISVANKFETFGTFIFNVSFSKFHFYTQTTKTDK